MPCMCTEMYAICLHTCMPYDAHVCKHTLSQIHAHIYIYIYIDASSLLCTHKFKCPTHAHTNTCSETFTSTQTNIYIYMIPCVPIHRTRWAKAVCSQSESGVNSPFEHAACPRWNWSLSPLHRTRKGNTDSSRILRMYPLELSLKSPTPNGYIRTPSIRIRGLSTLCTCMNSM